MKKLLTLALTLTLLLFSFPLLASGEEATLPSYVPGSYTMLPSHSTSPGFQDPKYRMAYFWGFYFVYTDFREIDSETLDALYNRFPWKECFQRMQTAEAAAIRR